ncbi:MAG TPA: hypothetical protein VGE32_03805 [Cellvibrio sp.]
MKLPNFKLLGVSLLLIGSSVYWFVFGSASLTSATRDAGASGAGHSAQPLPIQTADSVLNSVVNETSAKKEMGPLKGFMGTPAETAEVKKWFAQHGELFGEADLEYQSYDENTLRSLGNNGDLRALHRLAEICLDKDHYTLEGYGPAAAEGHLWMAAILGSSKALADLALMHDARVFGAPNMSGAEKRLAAIEVLARYNAASLRGNRYPDINDASAFKETYQINLSSEEQLLVNQRAKEIYENMSSKRRELGLDEFDNTVPDSVNNFFASQELIFKSDRQTE